MQIHLNHSGIWGDPKPVEAGIRWRQLALDDQRQGKFRRRALKNRNQFHEILSARKRR
jgi:hypothetical protein